MVDVNLLFYLVYSVLTFAGHDEPTTEPSMKGWRDESEFSITREWNQHSFDYSVEQNEESCPPGEYFSDCDAGCQETCENVGQEVICPRMCVPGCVCEEPGTVRGPDGTCIPPPMCPSNVAEQSTKQNAELPWFWRHENREPKATQNEDVLSLEGQINSETQMTRHPERHPSIWGRDDKVDSDEIDHAELNPKISGGECSPTEIISCKKFCERSCDNWDQKDIPCPNFCIRGCICKPGYVRGPKGSCIEPKNCPKNSRVFSQVQESQPDILGGNHGCPNNEECTKYCREHRGKEVGTCQGYQHMECLCPK